MTLIVACGLKREARIIGRAGGDVIAVAGGGDAARLDRELDEQAELRPGLILSCGIAGALAPSLRTGDVVIDGDAAVVEHLRQVLPQAMIGSIVGGDAIIATARDKQGLARRTGAVAADMESHIARAVARRKGLPFGALRVISDEAEDNLPPAALVGMRPDGGMALGAVLGSLAHRPGQLPALMRTGRQAGRAFDALGQAFEAVIRSRLDRINLSEM